MSPVESQFHVPPFPPFPSAERYVRLGSQDDALQRVCRAVEAWEAISLVIGPPGTGKSLLCRMLKNHFAGKREVIVFGDAMLENPVSLQRHLLSRLDRIRGVASASNDHHDPQLAIVERIANSSSEFAGLLLLVDEAQDLTPETLDTIRILTNTMTSEGRPCVSAVLAGGPKLDETLALPSLEALVQRVATRCYVHPLSGDETVQYVREVLKRCGGWDESQIEDSAIRSIHRACSGVPRLINQLMTASIDYAVSTGKKQVNGQTVDQAWAILQQLPSPIVDEPTLARPTNEVEFGPLQDLDQPSHSQSEACETNSITLHQGAKGAIWEDDATASSEPSIFNRDAGLVDDDFDMLEIEPCDTPKAYMELSLEREVELELAPQFELETDVVPESETPLEAFSMDCQTIGNFDQIGSELAEFQIDSLHCDSDSSVKPAAEIAGSNVDQKLCDKTSCDRESCEQDASGEGSSDHDLFGNFDEEESVESVSPSISLRAVAGQFAEPKEDLESSLHREILSLRGAASAPVVWMEEGESTMPIDDDRDLLVVEDDVEVDGVAVSNEVERVESAGQTMAVDFQAMLAKMRSPGR